MNEAVEVAQVAQNLLENTGEHITRASAEVSAPVPAGLAPEGAKAALRDYLATLKHLHVAQSVMLAHQGSEDEGNPASNAPAREQTKPEPGLEEFGVGCQAQRSPVAFGPLDDGEGCLMRQVVYPADKGRKTVPQRLAHGFPGVSRNAPGQLERGREFEDDVGVEARARHAEEVALARLRGLAGGCREPTNLAQGDAAW